MVRRAKEASDERREIAAIRRKYYDALRDGLSKEDAAAFAQGQTQKKPAAVKPAAAVSKPDDDLTKIEGIGPAFVAKLKNVGVTRFDQIALWNDAQIKRHDEEFGLRGRITRENWVGQAKQLVK